MSRHTDSLASVIAQEIEDHLMRNPHASDTTMGIWQWWLRNTGARARIEDVEAALDQLVAAGALIVRPMPSGEHLYVAARKPGDAS